jgi:hypothetical protein
MMICTLRLLSDQATERLKDQVANDSEQTEHHEEPKEDHDKRQQDVKPVLTTWPEVFIQEGRSTKRRRHLAIKLEGHQTQCYQKDSNKDAAYIHYIK